MQTLGNRTADVMLIAWAIHGAMGVRGAPIPNCTSGGAGKPEICVQFDNLSVQPEENTDFDFDTVSDPDNPSVILRRGHDGVTERNWRVWSRTSGTDPTPRNIGSVTSPAAFDFDVKLLNEDGDPGAANVGTITLDPTSAAKFSRISGGRITGALSGDLFLQESSGGAGGDVSLVIDGDVFGTLTLPRVASLKIGKADAYTTAGLMGTASVIIGEVVAPASPATVIEIGTIEGYDSSHLAKLEINGDLPTNATLRAQLRGFRRRFIGRTQQQCVQAERAESARDYDGTQRT